MQKSNESHCCCDDLKWNEKCKKKNDDFDDKNEKCDVRAWECNENDVRWLTIDERL